MCYNIFKQHVEGHIMKFVIQSKYNNDKNSLIDTDTKIVQELIEQNHLNSYTCADIEHVTEDKYELAIPIGTIEFVTAHLQKFRGVDHIEPIEIPDCLLLPRFLKRNYSIVPYNDIPYHGHVFIKDVSRLKMFSYLGEAENFRSFKDIDKSHLFQVSDDVGLFILSEWRVYVFNGKIENISNYDGNPAIFPDVELINEAVLRCSILRNFPQSYSLDVMVIPDGTAIIEVHPFISVGLYHTLWGSNLLRAYKDGYDYIVNHNVPIAEKKCCGK